MLVPIQEDDTLEEPTTLDVIAELTEEELEEEFNKLSASDKIRYNQWVEFHEHYCHDLKEDLMGTKFFIFVKYVVYDWG